MEYSFKKGFSKGIVSALTIASAFVVFTGLSDLNIWYLVEHYLKPLISGLTVGGLITMTLNYIKVKYIR